jgi:hypothetical protein
MNYAKGITNFADYSLTLAEATGHRQFSPIEKYGVTCSKFLVSVSQDSSDINVTKEIGQTGISVLCGIGSHITGDKRTFAQIEFFGKAILDIAVMAMSEKRSNPLHY